MPVDDDRLAAIAALRRRYEQPVRIRGTVTLVPFATSLVVAALVVVMMRGVFPTLPFYVWIVFPVLAVAAGLVRLSMWWGQRQQRVIELRSDGIAIGRGTGEARVIPWESLSSATLTVVTTDGRDEIPRDLRLALVDGEELIVRGSYDRPLAEIRALVDPPLAGRIRSAR